MVSLLIIRHIHNRSDEKLVEHLLENNYFQYFSGEEHFQPNIPCVSTELVAFRQRIGEPGVELILKESIRVNEPPENVDDLIVVSVDSAVQGKK